MNILAIIPARSGSKGLKNKNIKLLKGKHLMGYTIEAAIESKLFKDVIVSTDSEEYAKIAKGYGAEVPFLRDVELSKDKSTTEEVILDLLEKQRMAGKEYDYFMLLQPTSPLRDKEDILKAIELLEIEGLDSVVSVCELDHSIDICNKLDKDGNLYGFIKNSNNKRRQDLEKYYRINGAIYVIKVEEYLKYKNFYGENSKAYIMSKEKSIDIDDDFDFRFAQFLLEYNEGK